MLDLIFLVAAVVGGTVMVCQFGLTLLGMGHDGVDGGMGHDAGLAGQDASGGHLGHDLGDVGDVGDVTGGDPANDHHNTWSNAADGVQHPDSSWLFSVLSFRTLIAAAAFFGVAGKAALSMGVSQPVSLLIALAAGWGAMYGMYWLMRSVAGFASSGNERIGNAVGRRATVYIPIPANGQGRGKVQVSMQNRIVEFQAVTDEEERLRTGEPVEVIAVDGSDLVRVRRVVETVGA
jgi:membrane protein implicated in regulation of membrane protease activity